MTRQSRGACVAWVEPRPIAALTGVADIPAGGWLVLMADTSLYIDSAAHPRWAAMRDHYCELVASMPASRLLVPDGEIWAEAGFIAGTLSRTQGFQPHQRKECLADALIFLTAAKAGMPVLTANRQEFDLIQQLAPEGQFIHY